jgi:hypothetical protein
MIVLVIILSLFVLGVLSLILDSVFTPKETKIIRREIPKNNYNKYETNIIFTDDDL